MTDYCIICGKELSEKQRLQGKRTCSRSCSIRLAYKNPDLRKRINQNVSRVLKEKFKDPNECKKISERVKNLMKNQK